MKIRTGNSIINVIERAGAVLSGTHLAATVDSNTTSQLVDLAVSPGAALTLERLKATPGPSPDTQVIIGAAITSDEGTLQLTAYVIASGALSGTLVEDISWSIISGQEFASISPLGLITAKANGIVIARATAADGSDAFQDLQVIISGQQPTGLGNTGGLIDQPGQTGQTGESPVGNSDELAQNGNMNTLNVAIWLSLFALVILTILVLIHINRSKRRHKSQ